MNPDTLAPLSVHADLTLEHEEGTLTIQSPDPETVHLRFSESGLFRSFLDDFAKSKTNLKAINQIQSVIDTVELTVQVFIEDKQVLRLAPGESADISYARLVPQWFLSKLGF